MITVPRWFPDIDIFIVFFPLFSCCVAVLHERAECRWYEIFQLRCAILRWRGNFLWSFQFALFKRPIP